MPISQHISKNFFDKLALTQTLPEVEKNLSPKIAPQVRVPTGNDEAAVNARWELLNLPTAQAQLADNNLQTYTKNIENYLGTLKVPIGLAGPLRVNGLYAQGDYFIPLATTEAALVASYNRGTKIISEAGGCTSVLLNAYVSRCPVFAFQHLTEVGQFLIWFNQNMALIKEKAQATTRFGKLHDLRFSIEGNRVYMCFDYQTADASGQNMVTIATQAAFDFIRTASPVKPKYCYIESNMSGDKKVSMLAFQNTRGRKVSAEVVLPKNLVEKKLHTSVDNLIQFFHASNVGGMLSGTIGFQGHYANALAALYIACGQDAACVSESALGITRFEKTANGDLYASATLPNIMVGTVGGGTQLPGQKACLDIMGLSGPGNANALAEVVAGLCLAGELSISAAMASDTFTQAHHALARVGGK